jgi:hypothetical protein
MMSRTQITLDPETQKRARERAAHLGISFAEYIRRLVSRDLEAPDPHRDPSIIFNLGDSGGSDVARDKDTVVGEAIQSERTRGKSK